MPNAGNQPDTGYVEGSKLAQDAVGFDCHPCPDMAGRGVCRRNDSPRHERVLASPLHAQASGGQDRGGAPTGRAPGERVVEPRDGRSPGGLGSPGLRRQHVASAARHALVRRLLSASLEQPHMGTSDPCEPKPLGICLHGGLARCKFKCGPRRRGGAEGIWEIPDYVSWFSPRCE